MDACNSIEENATIASLNRNAFHRAGVLSINVVGGPGCGKTTLILQTIARLLPQWQTGVIAGNSIFNPDIDRFTAVAQQLAKLRPSFGAAFTPRDIQKGLVELDLTPLGIVFIENLGLPSDPRECDLGEERRVAVFSAAASVKAGKYPHVIKWADAVVLSKLDLAPLASFNLREFREEVARLNPHARVFELSALKGEGFDQWTEWVRGQIHKVAS